jgi:hypothetical protein
MTDEPVSRHPVSRPAPDPVGDVVAGDHPVPITLWPTPPPYRGESVSHPLAVRLVHNFTHRGDLILDLTTGTALRRAIITASRRTTGRRTDPRAASNEPAALVVAAWPPANVARARNAGADDLFTTWRTWLRPGGCVTIVVPHTHPTVQADLVDAAQQARLGYLQHIVAASSAPSEARATGAGRRLRIHTDLLVLIRPAEPTDTDGTATNGTDADG